MFLPVSAVEPEYKDHDRNHKSPSVTLTIIIENVVYQIDNQFFNDGGDDGDGYGSWWAWRWQSPD